ncbi:MAG: type III polyketide synthase [Cytophagales bacterium]|nr:type III polyketide synthase [Cytophagales bacterium]
MAKTRIRALGTAVPTERISQQQAYEFVASLELYSEAELRLISHLYRQSHIEARHSVLPDFGQVAPDRNFYRPGSYPSTAARMEAFAQLAPPLAATAAQRCLRQAELASSHITHLITVSCTGLVAPGLDIALIHQLGLSSRVQRYNINFMGCFAAFNGLRLADAICQADASAQVLVVCTELCTLHYKPEKEEDFILANSLFADGAAAALCSQQGTGLFAIDRFASELISEAEQAMAWRVGDLGFEMTLSRQLPDLLRQHMPAKLALHPELARADHFAIHPGGKRILDAMEHLLDLMPKQLHASREVLRQNGNMSSPTILFILESMSATSFDQLAAFAFGPGLSVEMLLLSKP